ncbi:hypothetical protein [Roseibium algae]|uniref:RiboL-PSP-HEPN domain-containing protein n=1 Tax=Roseibium algae TaxID=3123038 RepID=A0ABU8TK75_9HYPH
MDIGTATLARDLDYARMSRAMFEPDDIGAIIRSHLESEQTLDYVLGIVTQVRFKPERFRNFGPKIELLKLFGTAPTWLAAITTFNNKRNEFTHRGKETITEQDVLDRYHKIRRIYPAFMARSVS